MKSIYIPVADTEIFCRIAGTGKPLVLLHGNGEDGRIFDNQLVAFSKYYQVIAIDTRGHGRSKHGEDILNFTRIALDVVAVLDYLQIETADFIGFSDGGNIALYVAVKHPCYVHSLILVGANLTTEGMRKSSILGVKVEFSLTKLLANVSRKYYQRQQVLDLMLKQLTLSPTDIQAISVPTLVVAGENDMIEEDHTKLIAESIPEAELIIVPNADHFLIIKRPALFNKIALRFLRKLEI